jgi:hypothetical protein
MKTVKIGRATVTPGSCPACGQDDEWIEGGSLIFCSCQQCAYCGTVGETGDGCSECRELAPPPRQRSS